LAETEDWRPGHSCSKVDQLNKLMI